jgi:hypothetical protein
MNKTRVVTTNPAGHIVSVFDENLTAYQVADKYMEFYDDIEVWHDETTIPDAWYIRCHKLNQPSELYRIGWNE